jgi:hypothetical protein
MNPPSPEGEGFGFDQGRLKGRVLRKSLAEPSSLRPTLGTPRRRKKPGLRTTIAPTGGAQSRVGRSKLRPGGSWFGIVERAEIDVGVGCEIRAVCRLVAVPGVSSSGSGTCQPRQPQSWQGCGRSAVASLTGRGRQREGGILGLRILDFELRTSSLISSPRAFPTPRTSARYPCHAVPVANPAARIVRAFGGTILLDAYLPRPRVLWATMAA